uniref:Uncharacterized protein n=1 Tax=Glossina austeni TaxID=7395 RepID=A0A1A9USF3_GLOAU
MEMGWTPTHSIVLLVECDVNYTLIAIDTGAYESQNDDGIMCYSEFRGRSVQNRLKRKERTVRPHPHESPERCSSGKSHLVFRNSSLSELLFLLYLWPLNTAQTTKSMSRVAIEKSHANKTICTIH